MNYSTEHIAEILAMGLINTSLKPGRIKYLLTDSRQLSFPNQSLFFALRGQRSDGHRFIAELYDKGVRHFVVSQQLDIQGWPEANFFLVENTLLALQKLAQQHRTRFNLPVIGITGSNGKTIVKEWLFQLLREDFRLVRSPKSYNSQLGVPLSVAQIEAEHELGIFEAGISQPGEMVRLAPLINCQIGLLTNIGAAHDEGFSSREEKLQEKLLLFAQADLLIYNADDPFIQDVIRAQYPEKQCFRWGQEVDCDLQILALDIEERHYTRITAMIQGEERQLRIPFTDAASIQNALHCWAVTLVLQLPYEQIQHRFQQLEPVAMRLEWKAAIQGCTLINDSYNSDLSALSIALSFLARQDGQQRLVILSDILQSGQSTDVLYEEVARLLAQAKVDSLVGIGPEITAIASFLGVIQWQHFSDTDQFLQQYPFHQLQQQAILLKGARRFAFERIAQRLARKSHNTVLELNLNALLHNLNTYAEQLQPQTKIMVMVKAAAYGSGEEVAHLLERQKVDYLAVAYTDEGVALRQAGIQLPILVLNPEEATFELLQRYQLEPEIYRLSHLQALQGFPELPIHLKLDTGMHRLGFDASHLPELCAFLQTQPRIQVKSIFSHLVGSEAAEHDTFSHLQAQRFDEYYGQIVASLGYRPLRHLLNSSGIARFPQYQLDMVRLGIGLYGIDASPLGKSLQRVHCLKSTVSQVRIVAAGETIGYNRQGQARQQMRVATISIGYADGLRRSAGNGQFYMWLRGQYVPTVGNICMDMCMLDVTAVPEVQEGDEVIVFGDAPQVETLAACYDTIPYEVFTGIAERVRRVYFLE